MNAAARPRVRARYYDNISKPSTPNSLLDVNVTLKPEIRARQPLVFAHRVCQLIGQANYHNAVRLRRSGGERRPSRTTTRWRVSRRSTSGLCAVLRRPSTRCIACAAKWGPTTRWPTSSRDSTSSWSCSSVASTSSKQTTTSALTSKCYNYANGGGNKQSYNWYSIFFKIFF